MSLPIYTDTEERMAKICSSDFERPEFKLGDVAAKFHVEGTPKDVQNWTNRGFLKPVQRGLRKDRLYSLHEVIKAVGIGYLSIHNSFNLAYEISIGIANRAESLVSQGHDFFKAWEDDRLDVYYYTVVRDGFDRGVFISKEDLAKVIATGEGIPGLSGFEHRIFEADEMIFRVLLDYCEWRMNHPLEDLLGCDEDGFPRDPNHPCYMTSNNKS